MNIYFSILYVYYIYILFFRRVVIETELAISILVLFFKSRNRGLYSQLLYGFSLMYGFEFDSNSDFDTIPNFKCNVTILDIDTNGSFDYPQATQRGILRLDPFPFTSVLD